MFRRSVPFVALWCLTLSACWAEGAPPQENLAVPAPELPIVYVEDFDQQGEPSNLRDLHTLGPDLIQLRLLAVSSVTVKRLPQAPGCGSRIPAVSAPRQQGVSNSATVHSGLFYVVRGSFEIHLPDVVLNYSLESCDGQSFKPLFRDLVTFTADQALEELTIAAHAVSYSLETSLPRTRVVLEIAADPSVDEEVQSALRRKLTDNLGSTPGLEVADTADYRVIVEIAFRKPGRSVNPITQLVKIFANRDTVETKRLEIAAHGTSYTLEKVSQPRDQLTEFYAAVADEVQRNLAVILLAEKRGWPGLLAQKMKVVALREQGEVLLANCPKDSRNCKEAQDAVPLLVQASALAKNSGRDQDTLKCLQSLSQAQVLTGAYSEAVATADSALELLKNTRESHSLPSPNREEAHLLSVRGDAYAGLNNYHSAEKSYDAALQLEPNQPQVYLDKARVLQIDGNRLETLQTLLQGLQCPVPTETLAPLHSSALGVIRVLRPDEFKKASEYIVTAEKSGIPLNDELALLINRREGQKLDANWSLETGAQVQKPLEEALALHPSDPNVLAENYANLARIHLLDHDFEKLNFYLAQADKLPATEVSADNREWIERIRARSWMEQRQYDKAYAAADSARQIKDTNSAISIAAEARLRAAQDEQKGAGGHETAAQDVEIETLYKQAAALAQPLVERRYSNADGVLVEANHALGQDKATRDQFERLIAQDPKDDSALNVLMLVCSQYLFQFDCAFAAAKKDAVLHDRNGADAADVFVNLAETAILVGDDRQTQDWLDVATRQTAASARTIALVYLYRVWLAMRQGENQKVSADFQSWQKAAEEFRGSQNDLNWLFDGARKALQHNQFAGNQKDLLTAMMDAMENKALPLPPAPDHQATAY